MLVLDGGALVLSKGLLASVLVNSCIAKAFFPCMVLKGETRTANQNGNASGKQSYVSLEETYKVLSFTKQNCE